MRTRPAHREQGSSAWKVDRDRLTLHRPAASSHFARDRDLVLGADLIDRRARAHPTGRLHLHRHAEAVAVPCKQAASGKRSKRNATQQA